MNGTRNLSTRSMVLGAILTALVFLLQYMGSFIKLGPFSISLVLIPIVIGAATCGKAIASWLGLVFGFVVILSGDAALFMAVSVPGTFVTVLAKGLLCGFLSALTYEGALKLFKNFKSSFFIAVIAAAIVCPIVNTGVFLIGCIVFFLEKVTELAMADFGGNVVQYMFLGLVGINFIAELVINIILSPVVTRLINIRSKQK